MHEARYWKKKNNVVKCYLCPRNCTILPDKIGFCRVRKNIDGVLYSLVYGRPAASHVDPVEKKPFFHFKPGTKAYSIGTFGCIMRCDFCCNWDMSQSGFIKERSLDMPPERVVENAISNGCDGIAYTYNEPTIFHEYAYDTAKIARKKGLYNVFVTCGVISEEPVEDFKYLDAAVIDFKGFSDSFYSNIVNAKLEWVINSLEYYAEQNIHLEVSNLIVPGYNDSMDEFTDWCNLIMNTCGEDTPVHIIRFFPTYKMNNVMPTPIDTIEKMKNKAESLGLKYVYMGNVPGGDANNTYCPECGELVLERTGMNLAKNNLTKNNKCPECGKEVLVVG